MALSHNSTLADNEPDWGSYLSENRSRLPDQAFADREERGFPHHWVRDGAGEDADGHFTSGEMFLHRGGLMAAFAAAMGARTGQRAGQDIIDHLEAHRRAIGMDQNMASKAMLANLTFQGISVRGEKGEAKGSVLFDTGASLSFVSESLAQKVGNIVAADEKLNISLADGKPVKIEKMAFLTVQLGSRALTDHFYVLPGALADVILGMITLRKYQIRIEAGQDAVFAEIEIAKEPSMWKKFLALLDITVTEEVTEEKAAEMIKAKIGEKGRESSAQDSRPSLVASKGVLTILGLPEAATEDEVKGKILALQNRGDVVSRKEHEDLLARVKEQEIEQVIAAAMQGEAAKLTPAMKPAALAIAKDHGMETLKSYIAGLPKIGIFVKLEKKEEKGAAAAKIDDAQAAINRQLGLSQETFLKYNAAAN